LTTIGTSVPRKEAPTKVTGAARYNADVTEPRLLFAAIVPSEHAHARILHIDRRPALAVPGVLAVVVGDAVQVLWGEVLADRPPLARGKVRYSGEPVAVVVAETEPLARLAASRVDVTYEPLPAVVDVEAALKPQAPLVHEDLGAYKVAQGPVAPEAGSNVADRAKVLQGDPKGAMQEAEVTVEVTCHLPQVDHAAMETRSCRTEILPDGRVLCHTASQAPFEVQKQLAQNFSLPEGNVIVHVPLIGGAFGGKASVQLEPIAYLASQAVGGRLVQLMNRREDDLRSSPVGLGAEARVRLGATRDGRLVAADFHFYLDAGAYADSSTRVARAIAADCTGPYRVGNLACEVLTVYTNHTYTTAWRGFGHSASTFAMERAMDALARELGMDPLDLRLRNALQSGDRSATGVKLNPSNLGDLPACVGRLREVLPEIDEGPRKTPDGKVRAAGAACFWKTSSSPPNAISSAIVTMNSDGSLNLSTGTVEFGAATKTTGAQILAEHLGLDEDQVHVHVDVNTHVDPEHWKTVASMSTFMAGRAVLSAAMDVEEQLRRMAARVLNCSEEDLVVRGGRVHLKDDPSVHVAFKDIAHGYSTQGGNAIGGQIIGRGTYIMRGLTPLDLETGQGRPGPAWTVGAQAVDVEYDPRRQSYRLLRAATVMDAGRVLNPRAARGAITGGMCMGLGVATRECVVYGEGGRFENHQLRLYKLMRYGEHPEYLVDFVETPQVDSPFGARPVGEHGVLGIPPAFAAALEKATGHAFTRLPITPEAIWQGKGGAIARDPVRLSVPAAH